jgi:hypothetical protein|tara:strand:+ start:111 stop:434 length:324 start_codon:yes stop_codon:yes gene_type:complete
MHNEIYISNIQHIFKLLTEFTVTKDDAVNPSEKIDVIKYSDEDCKGRFKQTKDKEFNCKNTYVFNHTVNGIEYFRTIEETETAEIERDYHKDEFDNFYLKTETKKFK